MSWSFWKKIYQNYESKKIQKHFSDNCYEICRPSKYLGIYDVWMLCFYVDIPLCAGLPAVCDLQYGV